MRWARRFLIFAILASATSLAATTTKATLAAASIPPSLLATPTVAASATGIGAANVVAKAATGSGNNLYIPFQISNLSATNLTWSDPFGSSNGSPLDQQSGYHLLVRRWSWPLVLLSYVVAVLGAYTTTQVLIQAASCRSLPRKLAWLGLGSLTLGGCGIWCLHFVGILAMDLGIPVTTNILLTVISLVVTVSMTFLVIAYDAIFDQFMCWYRRPPAQTNPPRTPGSLEASNVPYQSVASRVSSDSYQNGDVDEEVDDPDHSHECGDTDEELSNHTFQDIINCETEPIWLGQSGTTYLAGRLFWTLYLTLSWNILIKAFFLASSLFTMHYVGMYAMEMDAVVVWNPALIVFSFFEAWAICVVAFIFMPGQVDSKQQLGFSIVSAAGAASMHYTGIYSATFYSHLQPPYDHGGFPLSLSFLVSGVSIGTCFVSYILLANTVTQSRNRLAEMITTRQRMWKLMAQKEAAERSNEARTRFISIASHEIRTPLHAISGYTELLEQTSLTEEQQGFLEAIKNGCHTIQLITTNVLDFTKLERENNATRPRLVDLDVRRIAGSVVKSCAPIAKAGSVDLVLIVSESVPPTVYIDEIYFTRVLMNLVSNALKFSSSGYVALVLSIEPLNHHQQQQSSNRIASSSSASSVSSTSIPASSYPTPALTPSINAPASSVASKSATAANPSAQPTPGYTFVIKVKDTGVGIPTHFQHAIFEPFRQADTSHTREYTGTGLGLAICRQLVEIMDGTIEFKSREQKGTVFTVRVPVLGGGNRMPPTAPMTTTGGNAPSSNASSVPASVSAAPGSFPFQTFVPDTRPAEQVINLALYCCNRKTFDLLYSELVHRGYTIVNKFSDFKSAISRPSIDADTDLVWADMELLRNVPALRTFAHSAKRRQTLFVPYNESDTDFGGLDGLPDIVWIKRPLILHVIEPWMRDAFQRSSKGGGSSKGVVPKSSHIWSDRQQLKDAPSVSSMLQGDIWTSTAALSQRLGIESVTKAGPSAHAWAPILDGGPLLPESMLQQSPAIRGTVPVRSSSQERQDSVDTLHGGDEAPGDSSPTFSGHNSSPISHPSNQQNSSTPSHSHGECVPNPIPSSIAASSPKPNKPMINTIAPSVQHHPHSEPLLRPPRAALVLSSATKGMILLVEDNPINQHLGLRLLQKLGYTAHLAVNGLEAVETLVQRPGEFDLVLMDSQMPIMSGSEATVRIRELEAQGSVFVRNPPDPSPSQSPTNGLPSSSNSDPDPEPPLSVSLPPRAVSDPSSINSDYIPPPSTFKATNTPLPRRTRIPIVALTANVSVESRQECAEAGMDLFLPKPFRLGDLGTALHKMLDRQADVAVDAS
ncbi:hypothetical protein DFS34DRAFT_256028 [Phlyctochytrium arcticum]|nr:hypothetical protein DFS34DRAFT_256028 [Phlyctochytrium arcticum]